MLSTWLSIHRSLAARWDLQEHLSHETSRKLQWCFAWQSFNPQYHNLEDWLCEQTVQKPTVTILAIVTYSFQGGSQRCQCSFHQIYRLVDDLHICSGRSLVRPHCQPSGSVQQVRVCLYHIHFGVWRNYKQYQGHSMDPYSEILVLHRRVHKYE